MTKLVLLVIGIGIVLCEVHAGDLTVLIFGIGCAILFDRAVVGDPGGVGDQLPDLVVHRGGIAQDICVYVGGINLTCFAAGGVELLERGEEIFKPYAAHFSHDERITYGFGKDVGTVVAVLLGGEPAGRQGVVADPHVSEITRYAIGVAQRVIVIPYGRGEEFIIAVRVGLVGEVERRRAAVPVFAQLVDDVDFCHRGDIEIIADVASLQAVVHGVVLFGNIGADGVVVVAVDRELRCFHRQIVAVFGIEMEVVVSGAGIDLGDKAEIVLDAAGRGIEVIVLGKIADKGVFAHVDLLADLVGALIHAVGVQVDKAAVGGVGDAYLIREVKEDAVARHRGVLEVGDQREFFAFFHAGELERALKGDVEALFVGVPRGVAAALHLFDRRFFNGAVGVRNRARRGDGIPLVVFQIIKEIAVAFKALGVVDPESGFCGREHELYLDGEIERLDRGIVIPVCLCAENGGAHRRDRCTAHDHSVGIGVV